MKNSKLAIAIPTYNRAEMLEYNLLQIIDELLQYNISVYISDDSTNEETEKCIHELQEKYGLFHYKKNEIRLGHDLNCLHTILFPDEEYVWYIGDSMIIKKGSINRILEIIKTEDYDFVACNAEGRNLDIESQLFTNGTELFANLCWHLTMTGATVYNKRRLVDLTKFDVTKFKNFPQTAIIFEQFALKKSSLFWINDKLLYNNPNKNSYWASKVFEVFIDDFRNFLYNLPNLYSLKSKDAVLLQHAVKSGIFSYQSLLLYRTELYFNFYIFKKYKKDFKKYTTTNILFVMVISLVWSSPLKHLYKLLKKIHLIFTN